MAAPIDEAALVELRKCEKTECLFKVPNAVKDLSLILQCMTNHLMAMHHAGQSDSGGHAPCWPECARVIQVAVVLTRALLQYRFCQ